MTTNKSTSDGLEAYQLPDGISRRDLIRAGGATAGVAAAGGVPAATNIEYPVGESQAIAATTAAAIGVVGIAVVSGVVIETADQYERAIDVYSQLVQSGQAVEDSLANLGNKVGVDFESGGDKTNPGSFQTEPKNNELGNNMTENYMAEAASAYSEGDSIVTAQQRAREVAQQTATRTEWQIISEWNSYVESLTVPWTQADDNDWFFDFDVIGLSNISASEIQISPWIPSDSNPYKKMIPKPPDSYGGSDSHGYFGVRDFKDFTVLSDGNSLPDDDFPEDRDELEVLEIGLLANADVPGGADLHVVSPYVGLDVDDGGNYLWNVSSSDVQTDTGKATANTTKIKAYDPDSSDSYTLPIWKYRELIAAARNIYSKADDNINQVVQNVYDSIDSGETEVSDYISLTEIARDTDLSDETTRAQLAQVSAGMSPPEGMPTVTIKIGGGKEKTGSLYIDIKSDTCYSSGSTITSSEYSEGYFISEDGKTQSLDGSKDITVVSVDGQDKLCYEPQKFLGAKGVDEKYMKKWANYNDSSKTALEDALQNTLGIGGIGGTNSLLLLGAGLVAAYLLGS